MPHSAPRQRAAPVRTGFRCCGRFRERGLFRTMVRLSPPDFIDGGQTLAILGAFGAGVASASGLASRDVAPSRRRGRMEEMVRERRGVLPGGRSTAPVLQ